MELRSRPKFVTWEVHGRLLVTLDTAYFLVPVAKRVHAVQYQKSYTGRREVGLSGVLQ